MPTSATARLFVPLPDERAQERTDTSQQESAASQECGSEEAAKRVLGVLSHPLPIALLLGLALLLRRW